MTTQSKGLNFTRRINDELSGRSLRSIRIRQEHLDLVRAEHPDIAELIDESKDIAFDLGLKMLDRPEHAEELETVGKRMAEEKKAEVRRKLVEYGYPENYLELVPICPVCGDSGVSGGEMCSCVKKLVIEERFLGAGLINGQTFESFRHDLINDARESAAFEKKYAYCLEYADSFPENEKHDILLIGPPGVGKTFMLNCIGARVLERGFSVLRVTANRLVRDIMDSISNETPRPDFFLPDLLILDDLGTEPMIPNITIENILSIICERQDMGKATLIATNKDTVDLNRDYGDRVLSRLLAPRCVKVIKMLNPSIRLMKR